LLRVKTQVELKKQREKLEHVNQDLENKVNEKTVQLRQANERLGILEKSKSDFLKLVSHEMRTPLNIINGFTELLSVSLRGTEHADDLSSLKNYSDKLISLADTALLITEIQLGKYTLDFEEIDLYQLCEKAAEKCAFIYPDLPITYHNHIKAKTNAIQGDCGLLLNIVTKITENAIIACKKDIEISFQVTEDEKSITLEIKDNGPGFSENDLSRLFEIFAKEGPSESHNGFGLGLAAVKLVLDLHSGEVKIKNSPEGGASVSLVFNKIA
jgi:two-component system sensor histidine kinase/response regulator